MAKRGRAWKLERTVVHKSDGTTRSNRYSDSDRGKRPRPGTSEAILAPRQRPVPEESSLQGLLA